MTKGMTKGSKSSSSLEDFHVGMSENGIAHVLTGLLVNQRRGLLIGMGGDWRDSQRLM